jgi:hypothetical protein
VREDSSRLTFSKQSLLDETLRSNPLIIDGVTYSTYESFINGISSGRYADIDSYPSNPARRLAEVRRWIKDVLQYLPKQTVQDPIEYTVKLGTQLRIKPFSLNQTSGWIALPHHDDSQAPSSAVPTAPPPPPIPVPTSAVVYGHASGLISASATGVVSAPPRLASLPPLSSRLAGTSHVSMGQSDQPDDSTMNQEMDNTLDLPIFDSPNFDHDLPNNLEPPKSSNSIAANAHLDPSLIHADSTTRPRKRKRTEGPEDQESDDGIPEPKQDERAERSETGQDGQVKDADQEEGEQKDEDKDKDMDVDRDKDEQEKEDEEEHQDQMLLNGKESNDNNDHARSNTSQGNNDDEEEEYTNGGDTRGADSSNNADQRPENGMDTDENPDVAQELLGGTSKQDAPPSAFKPSVIQADADIWAKITQRRHVNSQFPPVSRTPFKTPTRARRDVSEPPYPFGKPLPLLRSTSEAPEIPAIFDKETNPFISQDQLANRYRAGTRQMSEIPEEANSEAPTPVNPPILKKEINPTILQDRNATRHRSGTRQMSEISEEASEMDEAFMYHRKKLITKLVAGYDVADRELATSWLDGVLDDYRPFFEQHEDSMDMGLALLMKTLIR